MSKLSYLIIATLLLSLPLLNGCMKQGSGISKSAIAAEDPHAGHDHGDEAVAEEVDPHAGHDHGDEAVEEVDPHAGHDHGNEAVEEVDPHAGHDHGDEAVSEEEASGEISLTSEQIEELGIVSDRAGSGTLGRDLELTGVVAINEDQVTHVAPRIGGIIRKVYRSLGDDVKAGTPLLEIDSIELAEEKSNYLALLSQIELALQTKNREEMLFDKGISAEKDYLEAKQAHSEMLISKRSAEQKLTAMGMSESQISGLPDAADDSFTSYTVFSPIAGEIIQKHASIGEMVEAGTEVYTVGNMCSIWIQLNVYQQDFADVREGMNVLIDAGDSYDQAFGTIDYIDPIIGEATRTATARVRMDCMDHVLRPGLFIKGYMEVAGEYVDLVVPQNSVIDLDQDKMVFVRTGTSFEPRLVTIGTQTAASIEILSGLKAGEEIVIKGAFQLKAELLKGTFDPHAGHAH